MNSINPPGGVPEIVGTMLRVRLLEGILWEVNVYGVARIAPAMTCCGGFPLAVVVCTDGRELQTDHEYAHVKALLDLWRFDNKPPRPAA